MANEYGYTDKYAKIRIRVPKDTLQNPTFDLNYNADLVVSQYSKRKWRFGKRLDLIDVYSTDPRATINGLKVLSVKDKERFFSVQAQAVSNYEIRTQLMGIGPGLRIGLGRFSLQGNHLYYLEGSYWSSSVEGRYDLLRF